MMPVARVGDKHVCPLCKVVTPIISGSPFHQADGRPVARLGDMTGCGATIVLASVFHKADGKGIAYLGSTTTHGGTIIEGSPLHKVSP